MRRFFALFMMLMAAFALCVGAQAAAASFDDLDQAENREEIMMLTDLGLFSGYKDGTFQPTRSISRAEIAKVMTQIDTASPAVTNVSAFADVDSKLWYAPFISYCAERGIISGGADGNFRPDDNVTGRELAKMLLIVVGYEPAQFTGDAWAQSVDTAAQAAGIYNGYTTDKNLFINRDDACLMINNALQCSYISGYDETGKPVYVLDELYTPKSVLENRFQVVLVAGVIEANAVADLREGATGPLSGNLVHVAGYTRDFMVSEQVAGDASVLGRNMTLYTVFGSDYNRIVGVPCERAEEVYTTFTNFTTLNTILQYEALRVTDQTKCFVNYVQADLRSLEDRGDNATATVVDHEGDGKLDYILISRAEETAP